MVLTERAFNLVWKTCKVCWIWNYHSKVMQFQSVGCVLSFYLTARDLLVREKCCQGLVCENRGQKKRNCTSQSYPGPMTRGPGPGWQPHGRGRAPRGNHGLWPVGPCVREKEEKWDAFPGDRNTGPPGRARDCIATGLVARCDRSRVRWLLRCVWRVRRGQPALQQLRGC